jgi:hypothetical protein
MLTQDLSQQFKSSFFEATKEFPQRVQKQVSPEKSQSAKEAKILDFFLRLASHFFS